MAPLIQPIITSFLDWIITATQYFFCEEKAFRFQRDYVSNNLETYPIYKLRTVHILTCTVH